MSGERLSAETDHDDWCPVNGCRCGKCGPCMGPPLCVPAAENDYTAAVKATDALLERVAEAGEPVPCDPEGVPHAPAWLRAVVAQAWEDGFDAGERDVFDHEQAGWRDNHPCIPNPFKVSSPPGSERGGDA